MDSTAIINKEKIFQPISVRTEEIAKIILDSAFKVHTALRPGLLESVYETCVVHELEGAD